MIDRSRLFTTCGLVVGIVFFSAMAVAAPDAATVAGWRGDLRVFADQLPKRHANAFHHLSRTRFEQEVAALDRALPALTREALWVGLDRIENAIGDGHTFMRMPSDAPVFGIAFKRFGADYRVVAIAPGGSDTAPLGARLSAIDGIPLARIEPKIMALTPADETDGLRQYRAQNLLSNGMVLYGLGITREAQVARYTFIDDRGRTFSTMLRAAPLPPRPAWTSVVAHLPLSQQASDKSIRCSSAGQETVYCNFTSYKDLRVQSAEVFRTLDATGAQRLIIDLRENNGGDFCEGLYDLVKPIAARPAINRDGGLFVLVGPQTFSAAMSNAAHFRQLTHAVLVGAPIGEKPNSYQEISDLPLPFTGWTARYSTRLYRFSDGGENLIRPDLPVKTTWRDYRAGRDRVVDTVLALPATLPAPARRKIDPAARAASEQECRGAG